MLSACTSGVGTSSDPVARTTFRRQVLEFADGHRSWNSVIHCIMQRCVWKVLLPSVLRQTPYRRPSIDVLKSRWNVSRWSSLTCTVTVLPPFPGKKLKGYKESFVQYLCPVVMVLEELILMGVLMHGLVMASARNHSFWNPVTKHVINVSFLMVCIIRILCRSIQTGDICRLENQW